MQRQMTRRSPARENPVDRAEVFVVGVVAVGVLALAYAVGKSSGRRAERDRLALQAAQGAGNPQLNFAVPVQPDRIDIYPLAGTNAAIQVQLGTTIALNLPGTPQDFSSDNPTAVSIVAGNTQQPSAVVEFTTLAVGAAAIQGSWTTSAGVIQTMAMNVTVIS